MATKRPARSSSYSPDSEKAIRFCAEWLKDCNGAAAARRAGYAEKNARGAASELMAMPAIQARLGVLIAAQRERVQVDVDSILRGFVEIAFVDPAEAYDELGALKPMHQISPTVRRAMGGVKSADIWEWDEVADEDEDGNPVGRRKKKKVLVGYTREVKWWGKIDALTRLGQYLQMWVERHEHSASESLASLLAAAYTGTKRDGP